MQCTLSTCSASLCSAALSLAPLSLAHSHPSHYANQQRHHRSHAEPWLAAGGRGVPSCSLPLSLFFCVWRCFQRPLAPPSLSLTLSLSLAVVHPAALLLAHSFSVRWRQNDGATHGIKHTREDGDSILPDWFCLPDLLPGSSGWISSLDLLWISAGS